MPPHSHTPSISGTDPPVTLRPQPVFGLWRLLVRLWPAWQAHHDKARLRAQLHGLSERELLDIGISRGEIEGILARRTVDALRDRADWSRM